MFDPAADAPAPSALPSRPGRERDVLARVSEDERLAVLADVPPGGLLASALEGILEAAIPHPDVDTFHPAAGPDGDLTSTEALSADERALLQHSRLAPGEPLAAVDNLARLGLETLSELVAACQRLTSWSDWVQSLLAAAMTRRVEHLPSGGRETADRPDLRPGSPPPTGGGRADRGQRDRLQTRDLPTPCRPARRPWAGAVSASAVEDGRSAPQRPHRRHEDGPGRRPPRTRQP